MSALPSKADIALGTDVLISWCAWGCRPTLARSCSACRYRRSAARQRESHRPHSSAPNGCNASRPLECRHARGSSLLPLTARRSTPPSSPRCGAAREGTRASRAHRPRLVRIIPSRGVVALKNHFVRSHPAQCWWKKSAPSGVRITWRGSPFFDLPMAIVLASGLKSCTSIRASSL